MKILVITDVLWRNDNGVGNSYSNIFEGMTEVEIANICCQEGVSQNNISKSCFQISETRLLKNIFDKKNKTGVLERQCELANIQSDKKKTNWLIRNLKRSRLQVFFWLRNLIWLCGQWQSKELNDFIDGFNPDIIFAQLQDKIYLNNLIGYVREYTCKPLVLYAWDDVYSLKQFSISPLFWIDRFIQRKSIRKLVANCNLLYTISCEQKNEYGKCFKKQTGLLYKGKKFMDMPDTNDSQSGILKILYTGNLYSGRYETILSMCKKLEQYNQDELKAQLYIYSGTDLTNKQIQKINIGNSSFFMGKVSEQEVQQLQEKADILLHIEPMNLKGSLLCRLSFSTKLVDYFYNAKCIFAVGSSRCSAMKYLKRHDAAVVSETIEEAEDKLLKLINSPMVVKEYAMKAWKCGYKNHQIEQIQGELRMNLVKLIQENK